MASTVTMPAMWWQGATHAYGYDAAGRIATFQIIGFLQASYKYDAMGRQAIRTLTSGPVTIHSVFDSQGRRIAEYNETSGALIREYVWNGWEPVALIEGGVVYFVRADHIGRPVFATNASGVTVWSASYLPFGEVHVATGALPDNRFPGQWYQSESGLHQNWMRDYDPTTGRYLQADPLGLVDGASVYGYVTQNPGRWMDPRGEHKNDKWYGYDDRDFHKWFHRCWKQAGNADAEQEEIAEAYQEWINSGRPKNGKCGSTPACDDCSNYGATEVVIAGGLMYLGYRCLRMLPSLAPPLWWTIPGNAVAP
jgi:RHS repeat-associated protein